MCRLGMFLKGKHNSITSVHDVMKMYEHCSKHCEIRLWCLYNSTPENESRRKRSHENVGTPPTAKRMNTLKQLEEVVEK